MKTLLVVLGAVLVLASAEIEVRIVNPKSQLVLDGSENLVRINTIEDTDFQIWYLEPTSVGTFYIKNKATGYVIEKQIGSRNAIIGPKADGHGYQQWYINSNKTISNAAYELVLDIEAEVYAPGNRIILFPRHSKQNQLFEIREV